MVNVNYFQPFILGLFSRPKPHKKEKPKNIHGLLAIIDLRNSFGALSKSFLEYIYLKLLYRYTFNKRL